MESGEEKLHIPGDFLFPSVSRNIQQNLMPPSHFTSSFQPSKGEGDTPGTSTSAESVHSTANPWLAITKAKQEIIELRKENQRILMLHGDRFKGQYSAESSTESRTRSSERVELSSRWEAEWRLDKEQLKIEAERLRGQVGILKEAAATYREELRDKDSALTRQKHEMGLLRDELCKAKTELKQVFSELTQSKDAKDKLCSQLERLERECEEEVKRLREEAERNRHETQTRVLDAEAARLKAGQETDQLMHRLKQQMAESQQKHAEELQKLTASFDSELATVKHGNIELQERLCLTAQDVIKLKSLLLEVSTERDTLKQQLSQMGEDFETQSAALQSLRTYIGQISPEQGEQEKLTETIQRLKKENETLQVTAELLTVRLNSLNDLLSLQEEEMVKKSLSNPLLVGGPKSTQVLRRWREKVYTLLVQLRSKDIEVRTENNKLLARINSLEQHVKHQTHLASVVSHSLQDKAAEVELEKLARENVELDLTRALKESSQWKASQEEAAEALNSMTQTVERFSLAFEAKMAEVDSAQTRLNSLSQRLTFAKRRVDTIQGLTMRNDALRRVQQATKSADQASESIRELQAELALAGDERDKLTRELKRTPELIESALADLRQKFEGELRPLQQELEQRRLELLEVSAGRAEAEQRRLEAGSQLEDCRLHLEQLRNQLLSQQEESDQVLREKVSEVENRLAQQLRDMEAQLNTARREHTKAVVTLRQFERHMERERVQEKEAQCMLSQQTEREIEALQRLLREKDMDLNLLLATIRERGLMHEYKKARTSALQSSACREERRRGAPEKTSMPGVQAEQQTNDSLMSVLEDLQALSAAVIHSSGEEEKEHEEERLTGRQSGTPQASTRLIL